MSGNQMTPDSALSPPAPGGHEEGAGAARSWSTHPASVGPGPGAPSQRPSGLGNKAGNVLHRSRRSS